MAYDDDLSFLETIKSQFNTPAEALGRVRRGGRLLYDAARRATLGPASAIGDLGAEAGAAAKRVAPLLIPGLGEGIGKVNPRGLPALDGARPGPHTAGPLEPADVDVGGGITRRGNTYTGVGNAPQSDLGSVAHLQRIAAAERGLYQAKPGEAYRSPALEDEARFASGQSTFRQATPQELLDERLAGIEKKRTVAGRKLATELYLGELANQTARGNTAANLAIAGDRRAFDQQKLLLDAITAGATARKVGAETGLLDTRQAAVDAARARGASAEEIAALAAGRPLTGDRYNFQPDLKGNLIVGNTRKGTAELVTPQVRPAVREDAQGAYVMEGTKKRYLTPAELAQMQR